MTATCEFVTVIDGLLLVEQWSCGQLAVERIINEIQSRNEAINMLIRSGHHSLGLGRAYHSPFHSSVVIHLQCSLMGYEMSIGLEGFRWSHDIHTWIIIIIVIISVRPQSPFSVLLFWTRGTLVLRSAECISPDCLFISPPRVIFIMPDNFVMMLFIGVVGALTFPWMGSSIGSGGERVWD